MVKPTLQLLWDFAKVGLVCFGAIFIVVWLVIAYPTVSSLSVDRIIAVSQLIVQLDSFLAAGWTVGFFYFWGSVDKGTKVFYDTVIATEIEARLKGHTIIDFIEKHFLGSEPKQETGKTSPDISGIPTRMARRAAIWGSAYFVAVAALAGFVSSAMLSIEGSITGNAVFLFLSLASLVIGICLLFVSWFFLNLISQVVYGLKSVVDVIARVEKKISENKSTSFKTSQDGAGGA